MSTTPGEPRPAATLVVLRDSPEGLQVLLTERPKHLRFMGGATVFPGGAVAAEDAGPDPARACALREAFEEVGFVLDGPERGAERLVPGGRWVTPTGAPVRFDAQFFLVEAPYGWEPDPDPSEVAAARWASPADALEDLAQGRAIMAPPTIEMLQRLEGLRRVEDALRAVADAPVGQPGVLSTRVSPLVHVVLAPNPGLMTGPGTNTYVVGSGPTFVVDPAVRDEAYVDTVAAVAGDVAAILVTHRHSDHTGGVRALLARLGNDVPVRAWGAEPVDGLSPEPLGDGEMLRAGAATLRTVHTPGHASDHVCFHLEASATLFAGDTILGEGTAVIAPPDGDMGDYLASLERLRELYLERIFPGHFRALDGGRDVIDGYLAHRRMREQRVLDALAAGPATIEEVVARAYQDTPVELHPAAALSARAHLELLARRGRARLADHRWSLVDVE